MPLNAYDTSVRSFHCLLNSGFVNVVKDNVAVEAPNCEQIRFERIELYSSDRGVGRDLNRIIKLLFDPIEPLDHSGHTSRSNREIAIDVPINIEDYSVII